MTIKLRARIEHLEVLIDLYERALRGAVGTLVFLKGGTTEEVEPMLTKLLDACLEDQIMEMSRQNPLSDEERSRLHQAVERRMGL